MIRRLCPSSPSVGIFIHYLIPFDPRDRDIVPGNIEAHGGMIHADRMVDLLLQQTDRICYIGGGCISVLFIISGKWQDLQGMHHGIGCMLQDRVRIVRQGLSVIIVVILVYHSVIRNILFPRQIRPVAPDILLRNICHAAAPYHQGTRTGPAAVRTGLKRRKVDVQFHRIFHIP